MTPSEGAAVDATFAFGLSAAVGAAGMVATVTDAAGAIVVALVTVVCVLFGAW